MERVLSVLQVIIPVFAAVFLGMYARRTQLLTAQQNQGLQQFVVKFGLPCVLFNSCLTADLGAESLTTMAMVMPLMVVSALLAFRLRKKRFPYHNLPQLFAAQESGMLGIPLYMTLFGAEQAYRMGVLDLAQCPVAITTIALLSAKTGENPSPKEIAKEVLRSPFLIMSLLGLGLNLSGIAAFLDSVGVGAILTQTTGFLAEPVSAVMLFSVGYNFALDSTNRGAIFRISALHFVLLALFGVVIQGLLFLVPGVESATRWAVLMYSTLPASYLAPSLGRSQEDATVASGVCSILTVVSLAVFCVIAAMIA